MMVKKNIAGTLIVSGLSVNTYLATTDHQHLCPEARERICQQRFGLVPDPTKSPKILPEILVTEVSSTAVASF